MGKINEKMHRKTRVNKVLVYIRLTREQILKIEHYAIVNELDVSEAHRRLLEAGFEVPPSIPDAVDQREFFEHRVKWIDPTGELGLNLEPEGETDLEKEIRVTRQAEEEGRKYREELYKKKFNGKLEPDACNVCGVGDFQFTWYPTEKEGICYKGHRSKIEDYFNAGTTEGTDNVE